MYFFPSFQRPIFHTLARVSALVVLSLVFTVAPIFAFQSFEEFSRSKNKSYSVDVTPSTDPVEAHPGEGFDLHLQVKLSKGWHIYSLESQGKNATLATQIRFNENVFQAKAPWVEPQPIITLDGALDRVVRVHKDAVRFSRNLMVPSHLKPGTYPISGTIEFRACDNKICSLPRKITFQTPIHVQPQELK